MTHPGHPASVYRLVTNRVVPAADAACGDAQTEQFVRIKLSGLFSMTSSITRKPRSSCPMPTGETPAWHTISRSPWARLCVRNNPSSPHGPPTGLDGKRHREIPVAAVIPRLQLHHLPEGFLRLLKLPRFIEGAAQIVPGTILAGAFRPCPPTSRCRCSTPGCGHKSRFKRDHDGATNKPAGPEPRTAWKRSRRHAITANKPIEGR